LEKTKEKKIRKVEKKSNFEKKLKKNEKKREKLEKKSGKELSTVKCVWGNSDSPTPFRLCFN